ncbi:MAG TPA: hypothetical protein DDX86_04220 [Akkermansia sp.]|nr:hypothetical protein [Akkermansia sp.]
MRQAPPRGTAVLPGPHANPFSSAEKTGNGRGKASLPPTSGTSHPRRQSAPPPRPFRHGLSIPEEASVFQPAPPG